jgi:hypothetical protein
MSFQKKELLRILRILRRSLNGLGRLLLQRSIAFFDLASYYRKFVEDFSKITTPLTQLTQKMVQFKWNDASENSFQESKKLLTSTSVFVLPYEIGGFTICSNVLRNGLGYVVI